MARFLLINYYLSLTDPAHSPRPYTLKLLAWWNLVRALRRSWVWYCPRWGHCARVLPRAKQNVWVRLVV